MKKAIFTLLTVFAVLIMTAGNTWSQVTIVGDPTNYTTIQAAIDACLGGETINIAAGTYEITSQIDVDKDISMVGQGTVIIKANNPSWSTTNGEKHLIGIYAGTQVSPVTFSNITMDCNNECFGLNTYNNAYGVLNDVTINKSKGAGLTVNGSNIIATNLNTSDNAWGAVNVDPGSGVTDPTVFTLNSGTLSESNQIWSDGSNVTATATVTVNTPLDYSEYVLGDGVHTGTHFWTNRALTNFATINGGTTVYSSIQNAIDAAASGDVIDVAAGTYTEDVAVNKSVTIIGAGPTTIVQPTASANPAFTVSADNVTIQDLEITHPTILTYGVSLVTGATTGFTLQNVDITNIGGATAAANGHGIYIYNSFSDLTVTDCLFSSGYQGATSRGIGIFAPNNLMLSNFDISGSTFEYFFVGIYLRSSIDGMDVTTSTFGPFELDDCTAAVAGVYIGDGTDDNFDIENITVTGNTFTNYGRGVYVWNYAANTSIDNFDISGNTFTNSIWSSAVRFIIGLNDMEDYSINGDGIGDGINIDDNDFTQGFDIGANVALIDLRTYDANLLSCKVAVTDNVITFSGAPYTDAMYAIQFFVGSDGFYNTIVSGNVLSGGGTGGTGVPVSTGINVPHYAASNTWTHALELNISNNQLTAFDQGIGIYDAVNSQYGNLPVGTDLDINNNDLAGNTLGINYGTGAIVDAELNWWGTVVESEIQALFTGNVDYDPWIGKAETQTASGGVPSTINFPTSGVDITFNTLPVGGGTVTVQRYNEAPSGYPAPPAGATNAGLWLEITSSMPNFSFSADVTVDVTGLGFDASTSIMYFNTTTNTWVAVNNGTYAAGSPETYTFTTNHFTPFSFINTPATAYNIYLASDPNATASSVIYPNESWNTPVVADDWSFTTPIDLYIVPEVGTFFGASDIVLQWDNTLYSFAGVDGTGGLFDGATFQFFYNQLGAVDQVTINATRLDRNNFTTESGDFICKLQLNLLQPGFGPINFTSMDFRAFDGATSFNGVYVVGNGAAVKSYLGDVTALGDAGTGDGLINGQDLNLWSAAYWSGVPNYTGPDNYKVKYDVGPTVDNTVFTLPVEDGMIQFEDMVIFAISYGLSGDFIYPKTAPAPETPVELHLGEPMYVGNETLVPLTLKGTVVDIRGLELSFGGSFGSLVSVEKGALLQSMEAPVVIMDRSTVNSANVDLAIFGADVEGINAEGELITLRFEGRADVQLSSANIRNSGNNSMKIEITNSNVTAIPTSFALDQNYPNPFNPSTIISYQLPEQRHVNVAIFNMLGEEVSTLVNEVKEAGYHKIEWSGTNLTSGVYFYRIEAGDFVSVKKMMLMK